MFHGGRARAEIDEHVGFGIEHAGKV